MGKLLGGALIAGGALRLFLAFVRQRRQEIQLLGELAAALESMAAAIRWQKRTLPDILLSMTRYPLAGRFFQDILTKMRGGTTLQAAWIQAFSAIEAGRDVLLSLELSGDEEKLTGALLYGAKQLQALCRRRETTRRQEMKLCLAGLLSAAGGLIIVLI